MIKLHEQPHRPPRRREPSTAEWVLSGVITNAVVFLSISLLILGYLLASGR